MFNTAPETAADVDAISALLEACPIGQTVPYSAINDAIGRDIRSHWWLLKKAQKSVEESTGTLFEVERGVGIRRLATEEVPGVGLASMQKIRKAARRTINRLDAVRVNDMPEQDQRKIIAHKSQLGAIAMVADGRKSITLTTEIEKTGTAIPAGRVLEVFKS